MSELKSSWSVETALPPLTDAQIDAAVDRFIHEAKCCPDSCEVKKDLGLVK